MAEIKSNYIDVSFSSNSTTKSTKPRYQWDHGIILRISGLTSENTVQMHCAFEGQTSPAIIVTTSKTDDACTVQIPDELFQQSRAIRCYAYVENDSMGVTFYEVRIPIIPRAKPSDYVYDPVDVIPNIAELLAEIEEMREATAEANEAAEYAYSVSTIRVSDTEPTEEHVEVWIDPEDEEEFQIPEIKDSVVSYSDTWSSQKIQQKISTAQNAAVKAAYEFAGTESANVYYEWEELAELSESDLYVVLEAGNLRFTDVIQSNLDSLSSGTEVSITIEDNVFKMKMFGEIKDSLLVKNGEQQICHKVKDTLDELLTEITYETVALEDWSSIIVGVTLPCTIDNQLGKQLSQITYSACGAYLDGVHDDFEAMYRAHFIGDYCGCDVVQHGGTIYKANSGWIEIQNHNVDLSGCTLKIDSYNRYGFYWLSSTSVWTLEDSVLDTLRPQMTEYSNTWSAVETGFPSNGLFVITHPNAVVRWNEGEQTTEDRVEVVRHSCDGRVYSTVIDTAPDDAQVTYHKYPETQLTFRGCTLDIDISMSSVAMYFMRCERSNVVIRDFTIVPTRRTTMNIGYRGAVFSLNKCADIIMDNIKGVNIAGRPRDEYPRGVAGYILNAVCVLDLTVRDCNLLGYWGCVGLNGAKEITFDGCELNRVDIHDYFRNLTINNCRIYGQTINFGYGKGAVNISNCSVMTDWVHQIVNLRCDYGRYFEGEINISNVDCVYTGPSYFDIVSGITMFSAESAANTGLFMNRYPTISVSNVTLRVLKESYAGYVFNMHPDLENTIDIADKRKVINYTNLAVYDENGDLQQIGVCPIDGVVGSTIEQKESLAGLLAELNDYSLRLKALEDNAGTVVEPTEYLYYSKRILKYNAANTNIRLTLPYENSAAIYKLKVNMTEGSDVTVTITDWTTSHIAEAGEDVYIRVPSGDMSSGKTVIFAVYPGSNIGSYVLTVERTTETDSYSGEIQVDFTAA